MASFLGRKARTPRWCILLLAVAAGATLSLVGPAIAPAGPAPAQVGPAIAPVSPAPTQAGPTPTQAGPVITQAGGASSQDGPQVLLWNPPECRLNGFCATISTQEAVVCVDDMIRYTITVANSGEPGACVATNVSVCFWAPNNPPNSFPDICSSTNTPTFCRTGLTLLPGQSMTFSCPTIPQLCFPVTDTGTVRAWLCVVGMTQLGDIILDARSITTRVELPPCNITCPPEAECVSTGDCEVCENSTDLRFCGPDDVDSYFWTITGNGTIVGSNTGKCVMVNAGSRTCGDGFTLHLTVTKDDCSNTCDKHVTVNPKPPCTITGPDTLCPDTTGTTYCGPSNVDTWSWSISGNGTIVGSTTSQCVTVNATDLGEFTLTLDVTRDNCCKECEKTVEVACPCRVTGGGNDGKIPPNGWATDSEEGDFYTFGGQVGAPTASAPQPWGEWTHRQHTGAGGSWTFHAGTASAPDAALIQRVQCSDPPACRPANNPAPTKKIDFEGIGVFKNVKTQPSDLPPGCSVRVGSNSSPVLYAFEVHIEDLGEPGSPPPAPDCPPEGFGTEPADCSCPDFYRITIHCTTDHSSDVLYEVFGYIDGGNLQIHDPVDNH